MTLEQSENPQLGCETIDPWAIPSHSLWMKPLQYPPSVLGHGGDALLLVPDLDTDFEHAHIEPTDLSLPPLLVLPPPSDPFTIGPLSHVEEPLETSSASCSSENDKHAAAPHRSLDQDIWDIGGRLGPLKDDPALLTWESFSNSIRVEPLPALISEAGPFAFDAALVAQAQESHGILKPGRILQSNAFVQSLLRLGLGYSSVLFPFNGETGVFHQAIDDGRMSGYSLDAAQSVVEDALELANATAALRQFANQTYSTFSALPSVVALARAVRVALRAVEEHLLPSVDKATSLLQIQASMQRPKEILQAIRELVGRVATADSDGQVVSSVLDELQSCEDTDNDTSLFFEIFQMISQPWLDKTMQYIGISKSQQVEITDGVDANHVSSKTSQLQQLRNVVSEDAARMMEETAPCLTFLRDFHPNHPLVNLHTMAIKPPSLQWASDWDDFDRIAHKAREYHQSLAAAVAEFNATGLVSDGDCAQVPFEQNNGVEMSDWPCLDLEGSIAQLSAPPNSFGNRIQDELHHLITKRLGTNPYASLPPMKPSVSSILHLSLNPMLSAQHSLLKTATLRSILYNHDLHRHLELLRSFYLFGSGIFASHLSTVLFSREAEAAERTKGVLRTGSGTMGLRLGSGQRQEWPPASSEVTLALMNVLHKCWSSQRGAREDDLTGPKPMDAIIQPLTAAKDMDKRSADLPGRLSFAIRNNVAEEEIERILDPQSIYALDFLRLSYDPPAALNMILSRSSLEKYDRVFKLLLRLLRMQFIVGRLCRDTLLSSRGSSQSRMIGQVQLMQGEEMAASGVSNQDHVVHAFRQRATHFITTICSHFLNVGISKPWRQMLTYISALESHVNASGAASAAHDKRQALRQQTLNQDYSLAGLALMHESTLAQIAMSLLLRNRQRKLSVALEVVLGDILRFAFLQQRQGPERLDSHPDTGRDADIKALYAAFDTHMKAFRDLLATACETARHSHRKHGLEEGVQDSDNVGVEALQELLERL